MAIPNKIPITKMIKSICMFYFPANSNNIIQLNHPMVNNSNTTPNIGLIKKASIVRMISIIPIYLFNKKNKERKGQIEAKMPQPG